MDQQHLLRLFNADYHTKDAVLTFIHDHINEEALKRMYDRKDVSHIADATELIDSAFKALKELYELPEHPKEVSNQSR